MKLENILRPSILKQPQYVAGKPIEYVAREFGLDPDNILKMASNENPLGPSPKAVAALAEEAKKLNYYPDSGCFDLRQKLAKRLGLKPEQFIFGNGSNEILELIAHTFLEKGTNAVFGAQSFIVYKLSTMLMDAECRAVEMPNLRYDYNLLLKAVDENTRVVFIASPNNPTGTNTSQEELDSFISKLPDTCVLVFDAAYTEFEDKPLDLKKHVLAGKKVISAHTFSKIYGLAGLRVGYAFTTEEIASYIQRTKEPFNVNSLAQKAAIAALDDDEFVNKSRTINKEQKVIIAKAFKEWNLEFIAEGANFVMVKVKDALKKFEALEKVGIIVRPNVGYGLPDWLRITIGTPEQNERFLKEFKKLL